MPAWLSRSSAPIHRSMSGLTGFFTSTGMSVPLSVSAISCIRKGLAVVRAPTQTISTPALRHSRTCFSLATSVHTFMPSSDWTRLSQGSPSAPMPSKPPGCVRGFQIPARNTWMPRSLRPLAVCMTCSSVSALQGPAIIIGRGSVKNPHSTTGVRFNIRSIFYLIIFLILFAWVMRSRMPSSS